MPAAWLPTENRVASPIERRSLGERPRAAPDGILLWVEGATARVTIVDHVFENTLLQISGARNLGTPSLMVRPLRAPSEAK